MGKKEKKKKEKKNEGSLPHEVWKGCAKAVSMCVKKKKKRTKKKNVSNSPMLSARRDSHQAAERANHTQGAHIGTITHSDTLCVASVPHPGRLLGPKMDKVREKAFGCSGSHRRRQRSSLRTDAKLLKSAGVVGTRQRWCSYLGNTCVTVAACRPGGGSAGSLSSWKNLYEK